MRSIAWMASVHGPSGRVETRGFGRQVFTDVIAEAGTPAITELKG